MKMHLKRVSAHAPTAKNCDPAQDILIRLDNAGFIANASPNAARLGVDLDTYLLKPHLTDFACSEHRSVVGDYLTAVMQGEVAQSGAQNGIEFPVLTCQTLQDCQQSESCSLANEHHWYRLTLSRIEGGEQGPIGALGTLHSVQHKHSVEPAQLGDIATDPVTALADRRALCSEVDRCAAGQGPATLALFAIDGMKAIFMQYGQSTADELRRGFAQFLDTVVQPHHFLGQVDEERFGVVLVGLTPREAREWAADTLQVFAGLVAQDPRSASSQNGNLTASAGVAPCEISAQWALRQAELGLVMARAAGGMQTGYSPSNSRLENGRPTVRAMERVVAEAKRRLT